MVVIKQTFFREKYKDLFCNCDVRTTCFDAAILKYLRPEGNPVHAHKMSKS